MSEALPEVEPTKEQREELWNIYAGERSRLLKRFGLDYYDAIAGAGEPKLLQQYALYHCIIGSGIGTPDDITDSKNHKRDSKDNLVAQIFERVKEELESAAPENQL